MTQSERKARVIRTVTFDRTPSVTSVQTFSHEPEEEVVVVKQPKPILPSVRPSEKGKALLRLSNVYQDYLLGIDALRKKLGDMDLELSRLEFEFYAPPPKKASSNSTGIFLTQPQALSPRGDLQTDQRYNEQLRSVQDCLLEASSREEVLDSEQKLVSLINRLKQTKGGSKAEATTAKVQQFWETLNRCVERLKDMHDQFQRNVFTKLKANCLSFSNTFDVRNAATERYTQEILAFLDRIDTDSDQLRLLAASFGTQIKTQLYSGSSIRIDMLVRGCDTKRFPVIRLFPELCDRFERLLRVATEWLTRDETFLFDLNRDIRESRSRTHEIQQSIQEGRERQRELAKSLKTAFLMVRNSNSRLTALETELRELQVHANQCNTEKQTRKHEVQRKEGMKEFLEAGMANKTRARYALQYKQMRLLKQLNELEQVLSALEIELDRINRLIETKSTEVSTFEKKRRDTLNEYEECRKQFDQFNERSAALTLQLQSIQEDLSKMEAIRNFKTSPDLIDNFFDRPASIKLSQSLQRRLIQRKPITLQPIAPKE